MLTEHGVPIAPRTFYAWAKRAPSKRALWDATITEVLAGYYEPDEHGRRKPESLYGSVKMWAHLQREGIPVAKSTVERLMRRHGWQGVRRQKTVRTTIADPAAARPPDLVDRQFGVPGTESAAGCRLHLRQAGHRGVRLRRVRHRRLRRRDRRAGRPRRPSTPGSWNRRSARPPHCGRARAIRSRVPSTTPMPDPKADSTCRRNTVSWT